MGGTTDWVLAALDAMGWNAPEKGIKADIREHAPEVPRGQIGLALRRLRARTNSDSMPLPIDDIFDVYPRRS